MRTVSGERRKFIFPKDFPLRETYFPILEDEKIFSEKKRFTRQCEQKSYKKGKYYCGTLHKFHYSKALATEQHSFYFYGRVFLANPTWPHSPDDDDDVKYGSCGARKNKKMCANGHLQIIVDEARNAVCFRKLCASRARPKSLSHHEKQMAWKMFFAVTASRSRAESCSVQIYLVKHISHKREDDDPYFARSCACVCLVESTLAGKVPQRRMEIRSFALRIVFAVPVSGAFCRCGNKRHKFSESCDLAVVFPLRFLGSSFCSCRKLQSRQTLTGSREQKTFSSQSRYVNRWNDHNLKF